jgi:choline dehydrogenase
MLARRVSLTADRRDGIPWFEMFDYVIIGAGSAGCVVAARLTEDPGVQVLLIEAGPPDRSRGIRMPLAFPHLFRSPLDWNFWTEPQPHLANRHLFWPRGRVLGGSSSINAMVHMDPCVADFDEWGVPGWTAADLLPLRKQTFQAGMYAEPPKHLNPLSRAFLEACQASGLQRQDSIYDAAEPAAAPFCVNVKRGRRWSVADAYLRPALKRGNLTVWTNIQVRRILSMGTRVTGVEYAQASGIQSVSVTREVILCAGAVGSPHLLLLSGIGPQAELEVVGVPVCANVPGVGRNLQDHLTVPVAHFCREPISLSGAGTFLNRWRYRMLRSGPLASNGAEAAAFLKSQASLPACDLEILFSAGHYLDHGFASPGGHGFSLMPTLLKPQSRGSIRLCGADPLEPPLLDPAYLSDPRDLKVLAEGVGLARNLLEQAPLARYRGAPVQGSLLEPEEHIREWAQTLYHPVGTCKLGSDETAVVDSSLRVYGVDGLRVADASIMPTIPRAHTNAATTLIGERAAQVIRGGR